MELINKYQLKQELWTMHGNKPISGTVRSMVLSKSEEVIYSLDITGANLKLERTEDTLKESKEKLINSL